MCVVQRECVTRHLGFHQRQIITLQQEDAAFIADRKEGRQEDSVCIIFVFDRFLFDQTETLIFINQLIRSFTG